MGMSIDKSITELEILKKNIFSYMPAYQAFTTAIEIMKKYRKIQEILNDWKYDGYKENQERKILWNIVREVEDGEID